jgi:hypothetical protein
VTWLLALGGLELRAEIEAAHHNAVIDTIVEQHATYAYFRTGHGASPR